MDRRKDPCAVGHLAIECAKSGSPVATVAHKNGTLAGKSVTSSHNGLVVATFFVQVLISPFRMRRYRKPRGPTRRVLHVEKRRNNQAHASRRFSELQAHRRRTKFSASIGHRTRQKLHLGSPSRLDAASSPIMGPSQPATLAIPKGDPSWSK